jgi:hypothetical protein
LSTATNLNAITILAARMMTIVAIRLRVASFLDISYSRREESGDIYIRTPLESSLIMILLLTLLVLI